MADSTTWSKRLSAWRRSGKTADEFCVGQDFAPSTLRWWSSKLGRDARARAIALVAREPPPPPRALRVARVIRASSALATRAAIIVEIADARIVIAADVDRDTLATVVDVLRAGTDRHDR